MLDNLISKLKEWMTSLNEYLAEQVWYQELKQKWDELDAQNKNYVKFGAFGVSVLFVLIFILSSIWSVHSLKSELSEKRALLAMIQSANDEIRRLKETNTSSSHGDDKDALPWNPYFETVANLAGFDKSSLTVTSEKPGASEEQTKETLFDIQLKHVNLKQVVRYVLSLENGQKPVKVRNLSIDTQGDPSGYLDAVLAVSAFTITVNQQ